MINLAIANVTIWWGGANPLPAQLLVGSSWLVLTVVFGVLCGRFVVGLSWDPIASDYDVVNRVLMPLVQLFHVCRLDARGYSVLQDGFDFHRFGDKTP
ncbi:hypothetical protein [Rosistilla ulvae]|uniref:hypothetical protein n=1 Tax=Rosistilla ulvae TaxID=1930277 RepID=UPI00119DA45C|nr:hypothetical protein [Rosistilla ulvae]